MGDEDFIELLERLKAGHVAQIERLVRLKGGSAQPTDERWQEVLDEENFAIQNLEAAIANHRRRMGAAARGQ